MEWSIDGDSEQMAGKARTRDAGAFEAKLLDDVNLRILKELQENGRLGMAELGRRVSMSPPAVADRVQRLERAGIIAGYRAEIDPRALGYPVSAVVRIRPAPGQLQRIPEVARETPEVGECYRITGEDCYLMRLYLRAIDELEDVLDRFTPYGQTTTSIIHSAPVPRRGPPLEGRS
jgi:Lrp/AsnC family leucine-responsive transcriptional regulator